MLFVEGMIVSRMKENVAYLLLLGKISPRMLPLKRKNAFAETNLRIIRFTQFYQNDNKLLSFSIYVR